MYHYCTLSYSTDGQIVDGHLFIVVVQPVDHGPGERVSPAEIAWSLKKGEVINVRSRTSVSLEAIQDNAANISARVIFWPTKEPA
jgi:hypothetical protein